MIIVLDTEQAEADLTAGRLACPRCGAVLRPWSWARVRWVRGRDGTSRSVRPRRARCASCRASQVLLPAWCQPRLADATEVIGAALLAKAVGRGYRTIAAELGRPPATVRRWLRRSRDLAHLSWLRRLGVEHATRLDAEVLSAGLQPQPTSVGDALQALAAAVHAWRRRWGHHVDGWTLIGAFTGGRLLATAPFL
jgi:Homeodomain-like domain